MITLHLTRNDDYEGVYLPLPASPAEIGEAWDALDRISDDAAATRIVGAVSNVWGIGQYLKKADVSAFGQFEKLNRIAELTGGLDRDQAYIFEGALNTESVNNLDDVIATGERLGEYLLLPEATTDRELGVYLVETGGMPFDESVRPYLDYTKIGIEYYSNHGGAYTAGGYVLRRDSAGQALLDIVSPDSRKFILRSASPDEAGLFYSRDELDTELGTVGHLRADFGHKGKEFWHTWWPHNGDALNTPEFKAELQAFVDELRKSGPLESLSAMSQYCRNHDAGKLDGASGGSYGYIAESENYRYCLRCTPVQGDYNGYLYIYDLRAQEMNMEKQPEQGLQMGGMTLG